MDIWVIFYSAVVFQGFFVFAVLLVLKKGNRKANIILSFLVLLLTFYLLDNLLGMKNFFNDNPHFLHITTPLWYLFPPLTYLYIRSLIDKNLKWDWIYILHFLPFLYILNQFVPFYFLPAVVKLKYFTGELQPPGGNAAIIVQVLIVPIQLIAYSLFILFNSLKHKNTSILKAGHISWLKVVYVLLLLFGSLQLILISKWIVTGEITLQFKYIPLAIFSFIIYSIAYLAIVQPETVFSFNVLKLKKINGEHSKKIALDLIKLTETEKLYLNSDLKYSEVASRLGISARYLTEVLNREIGKSFNDFINGYRVKEVQQRIRNNDMENLTLYGIALESGFNSKSSFNRVFKKHTGFAPSEFETSLQIAQTQKVS